MTAYYNEVDPYAAQWLRNLIAAGHVAPGVVDERDIQDVKPHEIAGFTQCHFFAGIGVWSYALRLAGWPDDRPVWTGSCPCQPFSSAGKSGGFDDERHLWPAWQWLIAQRRPPRIFGEQVASKDANPWIDLVQSDLEALGYRVAPVAFPSAGVGAPHIRDRLFWVADSENDGYERSRKFGESSRRNGAAYGREFVGLAYALVQQRPGGKPGVRPSDNQGGRLQGAAEATRLCNDLRPGPVNGFWRAADWLLCRDGKWRPVEPGTFPLAHGATSRVGRLRAYGNAINAEAAAEFICAYLES